MGARIATWAAGIAAMTLPRVADAGCDKDTDCKGDRVCEAGVCVMPGATASSPTLPANAPPVASEPATSAPPIDLGPGFARDASVSFVSARQSAAFSIAIDTPAGVRSCVAPCELRLAPGKHLARISGAKQFTQVVEVPATGGTFEIDHARKTSLRKISIGMLAGGGAMLALGIVGFNQGSDLVGYLGLSVGSAIGLSGGMLLFLPDTVGKNRVSLTTKPMAHDRRARFETWAVVPTRDGAMGAAVFSF